MRRPELGSVGRRLAQIRASSTQKSQAKRLGVAERTYQNYEQDIRPPDVKTLRALFFDGWDLNWVVCGVGEQRLDPRMLVQFMLEETGMANKDRPQNEVAHDIRRSYNAREFPAPSWVYDEMETLSEADALSIVHGDWMAPALPVPIPPAQHGGGRIKENSSNSMNYVESERPIAVQSPVPIQAAGKGTVPPASQSVRTEDLTLAVQLAEEALEGRRLEPADYAQLVMLIHSALVNGLPSAQVLAFARPASRGLRGKDDGSAVGGSGQGAAGTR